MKKVILILLLLCLASPAIGKAYVIPYKLFIIISTNNPIKAVRFSQDAIKWTDSLPFDNKIIQLNVVKNKGSLKCIYAQFQDINGNWGRVYFECETENTNMLQGIIKIIY